MYHKLAFRNIRSVRGHAEQYVRILGYVDAFEHHPAGSVHQAVFVLGENAVPCFAGRVISEEEMNRRLGITEDNLTGFDEVDIE